MVFGREREIKADTQDVVADIPEMPTLALRVMDMGGEIKADVSVDGRIKATVVDIPNMSTPTGEVINVGGEIKADVAVDGHIEVTVADIPKMPIPAGEVVMDEESKGDIPMDGETKARMVMDGESQDIVASAPTPVVVNKMKTLEKYSIDLTKLAEEGKLDPLIGRQTQIERVTQILCRRTKSNPCLIGDPGVGKTAIVEGLAQLIVKGDVPRALQGKKVRTLDMGQLVACTRHRGEFEDKLTKLIEEIKQSDEIILFIDEIHTLVGAGSSSRCALDAANILKPALARGELKCIGATTFNEYRKHFEKDSALERRFLPVKVPEPTVDETILILKGLRERYEVHHKISYTDGALVAAAELSYQYISDRFLPDKAIDLIDEAGSRVQIEHYAQLPPVEASELDKESAHMTKDFEVLSVGEVMELDKEHGQITKEKNETACQQDFEKARDLHDLEMKMKPENSPPSEKGSAVPMVTEVDIRHIISMWTGIPVQDISSNELDRLLRMEETLHGRIVGQDDAVKAVSRAIRRARIGMKNPDRPIASFLFLGPTGVGKSELAKALAAYYFGSGEAMIRFDMSEFAERYTVSKLIGAPPGYVGYREGGGHLTEAVRRRPYAVILFDEVEKAHPDVRNVMLQILDEGRLTDNRGRLVDFKNTVVIMTSNIGSNVMIEKSDHCMGFDQTKGLILHELTRYCPPEFLSRLDEVIVFRQLGRSEVREIADMMLMEVFERLKAKEIEVRVSERFREKVVEEGYSPSHGARPLRRVVMRLLEDGLAVKILAGEIKAGDIVTVDVDSGGNTILHI